MVSTVNISCDLLSSLLPATPFALAYVLPLLFLSLLLTVAGTFLTLDRTHIFPSTEPRRLSLANVKHPWMPTASLLLRGGIGGLCSGFAFGVHCATFLCLLIPAKTTSSPLSPKAFLSVWVLSALFCALLSGRLRIVTLIFAGATGYASLALAFIVIAHPSLLTRIAIIPVLTVTGVVISLLPIVRVRNVALRFANASAGSFGIILCIAILVRNDAWGNIWDRLWIKNGVGWGTSQEKGLSAAYCVLFLAGVASDWLLHRKFGENPDEKWDRYLATFTDNLPNDGRRAGTFTPFASLYDRLLGRDRCFAPIVPDEKALVYPISSGTAEKPLDLEDQFDVCLPLGSAKSHTTFLRKKVDKVGTPHPGRRVIKFRPDDEQSLSSEDDELSPVHRPFVPRSLSSASSATLTDSRTGLKPSKLPASGVVEYSDCEEDLTELHNDAVSQDDPTWVPPFIRRHSTRTNLALVPELDHLSTPSAPLQEYHRNSPLQTDSSGSVPATPSLIRAVDRITAAYTAQASAPVRQDNLASPVTHRPAAGKSWDVFWADVKEKATA